MLVNMPLFHSLFTSYFRWNQVVKNFDIPNPNPDINILFRISTLTNLRQNHKRENQNPPSFTLANNPKSLPFSFYSFFLSLTSPHNNLFNSSTSNHLILVLILFSVFVLWCSVSVPTLYALKSLL